MKVRRWEIPKDPPPRHPYRNSAIFHLVLAGIIVVVAWATAGSLGRAVGFAAGFFVIATSWSWWRWRERLGGARDGRRVATSRRTGRESR